MRNLSIGHTARRGAVIAALACGALVGCNQQQASDSSGVGTTYEDLAVQLQNCASNALDCFKAANCDATAEQTCRDNFQACREATRAAYGAFFDAVKGCFGTARQCVGDIRDSGVMGDAGAAEYAACRDAFKMCVQDNRPMRPAPGPCMQALRDCVQADGADKRMCFEQAHQCILNRLPMCGPAATDGGAPGGGFPGRPGGGWPAWGHGGPGHGEPGGGMMPPAPGSGGSGM